MRFFNLGMPKSGTTTLQGSLSKAGLKALHWKYKLPQADGNSKWVHVGPQLYQCFNAGKDPVAPFADFDGITQADFINKRVSMWPQMDMPLLDAIRKHHSDCKFILLTRDPTKVASSIHRWKDLDERLKKLGAPGLTPQAADSLVGLEDWIGGHYETVRREFGVSENFLEVDVSDPKIVEKLSTHLEHELTWWGVANANPLPKKSDKVVM